MNTHRLGTPARVRCIFEGELVSEPEAARQGLHLQWDSSRFDYGRHEAADFLDGGSG